jgi:hypothetical protein
MIKKKEDMPRRPIEIDLTGPDGNVFVLMGYAKSYARQLFEDITEEVEFARTMSDAHRELYGRGFKTPNNMGEYIVERMMESDYDNAVDVFDSYFGNVITLYR